MYIGKMNLPSYAFCRSDENGFVNMSDFVAMAINYAIEREMGLLTSNRGPVTILETRETN